MKIYYDVRDTAIGRALFEGYMHIRAESDHLFDTEGAVPKINAVMADQYGRNDESVGKRKYEGQNASIHIKVVPELLDEAEAIALTEAAEARRERRRQMCPRTMDILRPYWDSLGNIGFNRLYPGAHITPHYGTKGAAQYLRVHLGIHTDPGAQFFARGAEPYTWQDGQLMAFDDAQAFHWVDHKGTVPRTILCMDVRREALGLQ